MLIDTPQKLKKFTRKRRVFFTETDFVIPFQYYWDGGAKYDWKIICPNGTTKFLPPGTLGTFENNFKTQEFKIPEKHAVLAIPCHKSGFLHVFSNGKDLT